MDISKKTKRLGSRAGLEFTQTGRLYANDINTASADEYTTLNLKASQSWALGSGSITAYGRIDILTDANYVGSVIINQAALQFYEPAPGRNWTLGMRWVLPLYSRPSKANSNNSDQRSKAGRLGLKAQPGTRNCMAMASSRAPKPCCL